MLVSGNYGFVVQDGHLHSLFVQGVVQDLQQHLLSAFPQAHCWHVHFVSGLVQPQVLPQSDHNGETQSSHAAAKIPMVFMMTPFVCMLPELTVGLSVSLRLNPHRAGTTGKLLLNQCGMPLLLRRGQQYPDPQNVFEREPLGIGLRGAHSLTASHCLRRVGRWPAEFRGEIGARGAVRFAALCQLTPVDFFQLLNFSTLRVGQRQYAAEVDSV